MYKLLFAAALSTALMSGTALHAQTNVGGQVDGAANVTGTLSGSGANVDGSADVNASGNVNAGTSGLSTSTQAGGNIGAGVDSDAVTAAIGAGGTLAAESSLAVFFSDEDRTELLSDDEITATFQGLTVEEQAAVREECEAYRLEADTPLLETAVHACEVIETL